MEFVTGKRGKKKMFDGSNSYYAVIITTYSVVEDMLISYCCVSILCRIVVHLGRCVPDSIDVDRRVQKRKR